MINIEEQLTEAEEVQDWDLLLLRREILALSKVRASMDREEAERFNRLVDRLRDRIKQALNGEPPKNERLREY